MNIFRDLALAVTPSAKYEVTGPTKETLIAVLGSWEKLTQFRFKRTGPGLEWPAIEIPLHVMGLKFGVNPQTEAEVCEIVGLTPWDGKRRMRVTIHNYDPATGELHRSDYIAYAQIDCISRPFDAFAPAVNP